MRRWKRVETAEGPRFRSALDPHEATMLRNLAGSLLEMLDARQSSSPTDELEKITGIVTGHSEPPKDATMARLLPDFTRESSSQPNGSATEKSLNAALRTLHEPEIIEAKRAVANQLVATLPPGGGRFELTLDEANAWISSVNDMRLALGTMLGVGPEGPDHLPDNHPMAGHLSVYQWLTVLQEYLVLAMMGRR